jgi:hypothetical protein
MEFKVTERNRKIYMVWSEIRDVEGNERGAKGSEVGGVLDCVEFEVSNLTTSELCLCYLMILFQGDSKTGSSHF